VGLASSWVSQVLMASQAWWRWSAGHRARQLSGGRLGRWRGGHCRRRGEGRRPEAGLDISAAVGAGRRGCSSRRYRCGGARELRMRSRQHVADAAVSKGSTRARPVVGRLGRATLLSVLFSRQVVTAPDAQELGGGLMTAARFGEDCGRTDRLVAVVRHPPSTSPDNPPQSVTNDSDFRSATTCLNRRICSSCPNIGDWRSRPTSLARESDGQGLECPEEAWDLCGSAPSVLRRTLTSGDQRWRTLRYETAGQGAHEQHVAFSRVSLTKILWIPEGWECLGCVWLRCRRQRTPAGR